MCNLVYNSIIKCIITHPCAMIILARKSHTTNLAQSIWFLRHCQCQACFASNWWLNHLLIQRLTKLVNFGQNFTNILERMKTCTLLLRNMFVDVQYKLLHVDLSFIFLLFVQNLLHHNSIFFHSEINACQWNVEWNNNLRQYQTTLATKALANCHNSIYRTSSLHKLLLLINTKEIELQQMVTANKG